MKLTTRVAAATFAIGLAAACGQRANTPVSPSTGAATDSGAAADGSTLKASAPAIVSPSGGGQVTDPLVLTASKSTGKFSDISPSYQFQVRSGGTVVYDSGVIGGVGAGNNVTHTVPSSALNPDTDYTWRARAAYNGAMGPWSADGAFKSPVGAFIRGNEVRDPLTIGRTVGEIRGGTQWTPDGLKLLGHESHVLYRLPQTLEAGEVSMMIKGADEGSEGQKSKVFSMQEGPDENDITTDDYRMTAELRGADYPDPGAVTCRIIAGDGVSRDCPRIQKSFDSSRWYFWRFSYRTGSARLEVHLDNENGPTIYDATIGTGSHPYRPNPQYVYLGTPTARGGFLDATLPGGTYKNVYVGPGPRPAFPN
jgi:hypothetical protein